jgi:hypothetical protein
MRLIPSVQLRLPGDRMETRLQECCPRSGTRFATFGTTPGIISDHFIIEYGHADVKITKVNSHVDRLFAGMGDEIPVFMSHYDKLVSLPTVSKMMAYFWSTVIDSDRALWSLPPPRTPSSLVSPMRRSPSSVRFPPSVLCDPVTTDTNAW